MSTCENLKKISETDKKEKLEIDYDRFRENHIVILKNNILSVFSIFFGLFFRIRPLFQKISNLVNEKL